MSPAHPAPFPLVRVNINLYEMDVDFLKDLWGLGWQTKLRDLIHENLPQPRTEPKPISRITKTLGDLLDDD